MASNPEGIYRVKRHESSVLIKTGWATSGALAGIKIGLLSTLWRLHPTLTVVADRDSR
jgi:hypothetical protein